MTSSIKLRKLYATVPLLLCAIVFSDVIVSVGAECTWRHSVFTSQGQTRCQAGEYEPENVEGTHRSRAFCCKLEQCYFAGKPPHCDQENCRPGDYDMGKYLGVLEGEREACQTGSRKFCCKMEDLPTRGVRATLYLAVSNLNMYFYRDKAQYDDPKATCINVESPKRAQAINTYGTCVRVYDELNCLGNTKVIGRGTPDHEDLNTIGWKERIQSIGPCYEHDLSSELSREGHLRKRGWAHLVDFYDPSTYETSIGFLDRNRIHWGNFAHGIAPRIAYQVGYGGRTEVMEANLTRADIHSGTPTSRDSSQRARLLGRPDDDAGHILARSLGGSGTDQRNLFPQNRSYNRGEFSRWEQAVREIIEFNGETTYTVNLIYSSATSTRPVAIRVRIEFTLRTTGERRMLQGEFPNV